MASYKFTKETDEEMKLYCYRKYITITDLFGSFWSSYNTYYNIKKRWVISTRIVRKLKEAWVPLNINDV